VRVAWIVACVALTLLPLATGSASASTGSPNHSPSSANAPSGTADWAESVNSPPNWIFPYTGLEYYSTATVQQFQQLMFRPLYWLSAGGVPALNVAESLAGAPVFSAGDSVVTIPLKGWKWSNGTTVDAQDVVFWMNMLRSEKDNWAGYAPGELPDNVSAVTAASASSTSVTITFKRSYNTGWLLLNELSQITPMPLAWDISKLVAGKPAAPGSGGCSSMTWNATTKRDCVAVWSFMTDDAGEAPSPHEAGDRATYGTNPLWQVVDGPWRLSGFDASTGEVTMVPNARYSGPQRPHFARFVEVPFTSDAAEYAALVRGSLTVGYLPVEDAPPASAPGGTGPNPHALAATYNLGVQYPWQVDYFPLNFNSNGDGGNAGPIFHQLYIRQVMEVLLNEPAVISSVSKNYAVVDDGPVPTDPASSFLSSAEKNNPYPYSPSAAISALEGHGWDVSAGKVTKCTDGATCGSGIATGAELAFKLVYASGTPAVQATVEAEAADWRVAGIDVTLHAMPFDQVLGTALPCKSTFADCSWEMADWGGGWIYLPQVDPTGEYLFETDVGFNLGSYSDATNDSLIRQTIDTNTGGIFDTWENYATDQLPVIWQPTDPTIVETERGIHGVAPFSPLLTLNPENWYTG
jgi:peptide/nickel transport system substrate-binding protein